MSLHWQRWTSREGVDLTTISMLEEAFYDLLWKFSGTYDELFFTTLKNQVFTHYIACDPHKLGQFFYQEFFPNPEAIIKYYQDGQKIISKNKKIVKKWQLELKNNLSNAVLSKALEQFLEVYLPINFTYIVAPFLVIEAWQEDLGEIVSGLIKKRDLEGEKSKITSSLYRPWKKTALVELEGKLFQKISIKKLVKDYQFLRSWSVIWYRPIDEKWIENIASDSAKSNVDQGYSIGEIIKYLKPNSREKYFIEMAPYMIFFKDWRDDFRRQIVYSWTFLWEAMGKYFEINPQDLGYLSIDEIKRSLLRGRIDKKKITWRTNNIALVTADLKTRKMKVVDSPFPKKYQQIININNRIQSKTLRGIIANQGIVIGKVRVIKDFHDINKFVENEILVANTTHPNYLPAMKKAKAFITNEGGVVCHAAIVSRELNKPCIVGTKIATKVLKNGDQVVVDADHGIIKIIKG